MTDRPKSSSEDTPKPPQRQEPERLETPYRKISAEMEADNRERLQVKQDKGLRHQPRPSWDTVPRTPDQKPDADPRVRTVHVYLPPTGREAQQPHSVDATRYPAIQDDNLGRNPRRDLVAVRNGETPPHRSADDVTQFRNADRELDRKTGTAPPPTEPGYQGAREEERAIQQMKDTATSGGRPIRPMDARSTTTDMATALSYAALPHAGSQARGEPPLPGDGIEAFRVEPGVNPLSRRIDPSENVPGHEVLLHRQDFDDELAGHRAKAQEAGDSKRLDELDRLEAAVHGPHFDAQGNELPSRYRGDGTQEAVGHSEGGRRTNMDEHLLTGDYELAAILDTRKGHEFAWGDTRGLHVPGKNGSTMPPEGVYLIWRPVAEADKATPERHPPTDLAAAQSEQITMPRGLKQDKYEDGPVLGSRDNGLTRMDTTTRNVADWAASPEAVNKVELAVKLTQAAAEVAGVDLNGVEATGLGGVVHGAGQRLKNHLDREPYGDDPIR